MTTRLEKFLARNHSSNFESGPAAAASKAAPQAAALFSFGRVEGFDVKADLAQNPALVKHAVSVVKTVDVAVGLLRDLGKLVPILKDLGTRHNGCALAQSKPLSRCFSTLTTVWLRAPADGVVADHYPIVGGAFLKTLKLGLGEAYTAEVETAYTTMWGVVAEVMQSEQ